MEKKEKDISKKNLGKIAITLIILAIGGVAIFILMNWGSLFPEKTNEVLIDRMVEKEVLARNQDINIVVGYGKVPEGGANPSDIAVAELKMDSRSLFIESITAGTTLYISYEKQRDYFVKKDILQKTYWTFQNAPNYPLTVKTVYSAAYTRETDQIKSFTADSVIFIDKKNEMSSNLLAIVFAAIAFFSAAVLCLFVADRTGLINKGYYNC